MEDLTRFDRESLERFAQLRARLLPTIDQVDLREWFRGHRHRPIEEQRAAIARRIQGHMNYFAISGNGRAISALNHCPDSDLRALRDVVDRDREALLREHRFRGREGGAVALRIGALDNRRRHSAHRNHRRSTPLQP